LSLSFLCSFIFHDILHYKNIEFSF